MPAKISPDDWDNLFAPHAPRRGGPLRALGNVLIVFTMFLLVGFGAVFALRYREERAAAIIATATSIAATTQPQQTAMAAAEATATAERLAARTATAVAQAGPPPIGRGVVERGGNLRSEPVIADGTVIGLIWPGDQVEFLKEELVGGETWFRIRVVKEAANRGGPGVAAGTDGWAASLLLSPPQP